MSDSTSRSRRSKSEFYARPEIATAYDEQRFGGPSGAWVNEREVGLVMGLVPPFRLALDLGCGTGRLATMLSGRGPVVGIDTSAAMLEVARRGRLSLAVQGDAFALPFAAAAFDAVVALRLVFHFEALDALLAEIARIVAPGGTVILDTHQWSPRAWRPLDPAHWGGGVFVHSPAEVERAAARAGLRIGGRQACFLLSPYVYRRLPLALVRLLAWVEPAVPANLRVRAFWRLERGDA